MNETLLIESACLAMKNAHAPYSGLKVGAAILTSSGKIFTGCNVENASYGLTICAERVAVGCAIANGERNFVAIAISNSSDKIITPCGACRQVLSEFADDLEIILTSSKGEIVKTNLKELFPQPFMF